MKKYFNKNKMIMALAVSAACALPLSATAKVSGPCGDCHTMHNSQGGSAMASFGAFKDTIDPDDTANGALLRYGCIGCHTGGNLGAAGAVPYVLDPSAEPTNTSLAGGNFYWVTSDASKGHNVSTIPGVTTDSLPSVPGAADGATVPNVNQLTCAGTTGCHGDRSKSDEFGAVAGGHHGSGGVALVTTQGHTYTSGDPNDMSASFRMLAGIKGIEVNDWEYGATAAANDGTTNHNQYYGVVRTAETDTAAGSISSLCAQCHGDFHNGSNSVLPTAATTFSSPWVRHPTDFDMATAKGSEYAFYNGGNGIDPAPYSVIAPVATGTMTGVAAEVLATVKVTTGSADGSAIVTCISCHRAHGSPYADLLRWDYATMDAHGGSSNTGCFICHTTKDDV